MLLVWLDLTYRGLPFSGSCVGGIFSLISRSVPESATLVYH